MIDPLKRTLVAVKDLSEQDSNAPYILIAGAGGTRYYSVWSYEILDGVVEFWGRDKMLFACKTEGTWSLVSRDVVELASEETILRTSKADQDALEKLHSELHPDEKKEQRDPGNYL